MTSKFSKIALKVLRFLLIMAAVFLGQSIISRIVSDPSRGAEARYAEALADYRGARTEIDRWHAMGDLAIESFHTGRFADARKYAEELERLTPGYPDNWNYGNAIEDANIVLGLLALRNGDRASAKKHLAAAGASPGSPQMDSFGPNMSLAKALLKAGERDAVLAYFEQCRRFWTSPHKDLDRWKWMVSVGIPPNFGPNLR